jgi:hypothetical protein
MPRYFFDFHDGDASSVDEEGLLLDTSATAKQQATATLGAIAREALEVARNPYDARVEVRDEQGRRLLRASLVFRIQAEPDAVAGETRLEALQRRIVSAQAIVDRQRNVVSSLSAKQWPTEQAVQLLGQFEAALHSYRSHLARFDAFPVSPV